MRRTTATEALEVIGGLIAVVAAIAVAICYLIGMGY